MRKLWVAAVAAAAMTAMALPSHAGMLYQFTPAGSAPAGLPVSLQITFADPGASAFGNKDNGGFGGIVDFLFKVGAFEADLADLQAIQNTCDLPNPTPCTFVGLSYALTPETGSVYFNNGSSDFSFSYSGNLLSGTFNTDFVGPQACRQTGTCTYRGEWQAVDEPTGLALFAGALVLAAAFRRRDA